MGSRVSHKLKLDHGHLHSCLKCVRRLPAKGCPPKASCGSQDACDRLEKQLAKWHALVGPAAAGMVFVP